MKYQKLTVLWAFVILILCILPFGRLGRSPVFFPGFDKLVHCGLFFVLVTLALRGAILQHQRRTSSYTVLGLILLTALLYGALIELLQLTVFTWRSGEWADLFADAVGAFMALFGNLVSDLSWRK